MNTLSLWLSSGLIGDIGWSLIHFLWQGLVLAGLLYLVLPLCRSATARHDLGLLTLFAMAAAPLATFFLLHTHAHNAGRLIAAADLLAPGGIAGGHAAAPQLAPGLLVWLVLLWLAGVVVLSLRAAAGWCVAETWRRRDTLPLSDALLRRCHDLQRRLGQSRPVRFLLSRRIDCPMVVGWFKPVVLIPLSAVTGLPAQQLDALILHELSHIVRLDAFANALQVGVETVLFYHPAVWWVSRQVRAEREHCCDDMAVSVCGDVSTYVEALISLETGRNVPALGLAASGGKLLDRVARLLGKPANARRSPLSALVGLALLGLLAASVATAQSAPQGHQTLSIRIVDEVPATDSAIVPPGDDRVSLSQPDRGGEQDLLLKKEGQIGGDVLAEAHVVNGPDGKPAIMLTFKPEAAAKFREMTRTKVGQRLAVVVNNRIIVAPKLMEPIQGSGVEITGKFADEAEARALIVEMMGTGR